MYPLKLVCFIIVYFHNVFFSSLSKNKIGDVGFCTVMDALIATHGTLKKIRYVSYLQLNLSFIVVHCRGIYNNLIPENVQHWACVKVSSTQAGLYGATSLSRLRLHFVY